MTWLVVGGGGYIGGHVTHALARIAPVSVFDDFSTGDTGRVPPGVPLHHGCVTDVEALEKVMRADSVTGVVLLAARKDAFGSLSAPLWYYAENVGGCIALLKAMAVTGVRNLVYSSSAAVYGEAARGQVDEFTPLQPTNPYGHSKWMCERIIADASSAHGVRAATLRYFNVVGAARPQLAEVRGANLLTSVFEALSSGKAVQLFGEDYNTPDGSCVRDFVHVVDVADAHVTIANALGQGPPTYPVYNVGRGVGVSVKQMLAVVSEVTGLSFEPLVAPRRQGDPSSVVADVSRIFQDVGWKARLGLAEMVSSSWEGWLHRRGDRSAPDAL